MLFMSLSLSCSSIFSSILCTCCTFMSYVAFVMAVKNYVFKLIDFMEWLRI